MQESWSPELVWWISVVELPTLAALFWLVWRNRRDQDKAVEELRRRAEAIATESRESLAAYKLEVAKSYVSIPYLRDVERRLTGHLLRIDSKVHGGHGGHGDWEHAA